jgi:hypothetical protein
MSLRKRKRTKSENLYYWVHQKLSGALLHAIDHIGGARSWWTFDPTIFLTGSKGLSIVAQYRLVQKARSARCLIHAAEADMSILDHVEQNGLYFLCVVLSRVTPVA